jgi:hypothetical protein
MSLYSLGSLTSEFGYKNPNTSGIDLYSILKELQGIKFNLVSGFAAGSSGALTGVAITDTVKAGFVFTSGAVVSQLTNASISFPTAGKVKIADTATTNKKVLVIWVDKG